MTHHYDFDVYAWSQEQADALRRKAWSELDAEHLAEEIEDLGANQRRQIYDWLAVLLLRLLQWNYQPEWRCGAWKGEISEARRRLKGLIEDSPSLTQYPNETLADAYRSAINQAAIRRLELYHLPEACPWAIEEVLAPDFLP
jgi:hypothetical protein